MTYSKIVYDYIPWVNSRVTKTNNGIAENTFWGTRQYPGVVTGVHGGDWKRRIALRVQAGTPFYADRTRILKNSKPDTGSYVGNDNRLPEPPWSNQTINKYSGSWAYSPDPGATINALSTNAAEAQNAALKKLYSRIRQREEEFNMAPFLAELKELIQMILRPADALRNGVTDYLRTTRKKKDVWLRGVPERSRASILRKALAGSWLEWSFGWNPTISDVEAGATALARFIDESKNGLTADYVRLQASGRSLNSMELGSSRLWPGAWQELLVDQSWQTQRTVKYVVGHLRSIEAHTQGDIPHFLRVFGLNNWRNIVLGAWEVIPFSWLVDYFTNIGDILECWATPNVGVQWIVRTERIATIRRWKFKHTGFANVPGPTAVKFVHNPGAFNVLRSVVDRTCPVSLGIPTFETDSPWRSPAKIANMAAVWGVMSNDILRNPRSRSR